MWRPSGRINKSGSPSLINDISFPLVVIWTGAMNRYYPILQKCDAGDIYTKASLSNYINISIYIYMYILGHTALGLSTNII